MMSILEIKDVKKIVQLMKEDEELTADFVDQYAEEVMTILRPLSAIQAYSIVTNIQLAMETALKEYFKKDAKNIKISTGDKTFS